MQGYQSESGEAYLGRCSGDHRGSVLEWQLEDESSLSKVTGWGGAFLAQGEGWAKAENCARSWRVRCYRVRGTGDACEILDFHIPGFGLYLVSSGES